MYHHRLKMALNGFDSRCPKCQLPLCGPKCQKGSRHCSEECKRLCSVDGQDEQLSDSPNVVPNLDILTPIRCLALRTTNKKKYDTIFELASNEEGRKVSQ